MFDRAKLTKKHAGLHIAESLDAAIALARDLVAEGQRRRSSSPPRASSLETPERGTS